jgi:signal transduction histidine kinase
MFFDNALRSLDASAATSDNALLMEPHPSPELARLLREALRAEERDRRLMALDIHDGLLQYVIGALYQLEQGPWTAEGEAKPANAKPSSFTGADLAQLNNARTLLRKAIAEGRRLIGGLRPPILEDRGLHAALKDLVDERSSMSSTPIEFEGSTSGGRYSALTEGMMFRIAQEALANACKHSQSERIVTRLMEHGDWLRLEIQDWGIGFEPDSIRDTASGLSGIRERTRWMGGVCEISTAPGLGTVLTIDLPISPTSQRSGSA